MDRPGGVTVICDFVTFWVLLFLLLAGIRLIVGGGFIATMMNQQGQAGSSGLSRHCSRVLGAGVGCSFSFWAPSTLCREALGLLKLKEWARIVGVVLAASAIFCRYSDCLARFAHFQPGASSSLWSYSGSLSGCLIIGYLLKPEVKAAFQAPQVRAASA